MSSELRPIRVPMEKIEQAKPDTFAIQRIMKEAGVIFEYQIDGLWKAGPPTKKPEAKRAVFPSINELRYARDAYFAWTDLEELRTKGRMQDKLLERPERSDVILQRLLTARKSGTPLILFVPWGVRPNGSFGANEKEAMNKILLLQETWTRRQISTSILLMPADLYATEVNNQVSAASADEYFDIVIEQAESNGFMVKPWSQIRQENWEYYQQRSAQLDGSGLESVISQKKISAAQEAAGRRSGYLEEKDIKNAAYAYLRERICEAEIVETIYRPVKVSMVEKNKDNEVDRDLPRVYIIPPYLQFPWLK